MGRSGGGFGGGGFGGGFSSGGGFGGSFGGGQRQGGRSSAPFGGGSSPGGFGGGGSFWGGFWLGNLLGGSRGQTVVVQQPPASGSGGGGGAPTPGGPSNGGLNDPGSRQSNNLGCLWICIAVVAIVFIIAVFGGLFESGSFGVPASTVERTVLPAGAAEESGYFIDEDGDWVHSSSRLEAGLKHFYEETGVWPYIYILPNGTAASSQQLTEMAQRIYDETFTDSAHFVLVFCDNGQGGYRCGYYGGQEARTVLDDEAIQILAAYLERNYDDLSLSEEEIFSNTFAQTADHIMSTTMNPVIPVAVVVGAVVVIIVIAFMLKRRQEAKACEAERMERILNTPLERFGDKDLEELEKKYSGVNTAEADDKAPGPE